jgi:3-oxoacyl-[acyl-carrier protein] reductase
VLAIATSPTGVCMQKLSGKVAIVTGSSKGFGSAIAKALAAEGASIVVNYASDKTGAETTLTEIRGRGGKAIAVQGSVSVSSDVVRIFNETTKAFGRVDIVVNNAGVYSFGPLSEIKEEEYRRQFDTNVLGTLLMCKEASLRFGETGGSIINIGTAGTTLNLVGTVMYTATKGASDSITHVLANELGPKHIRVNSVSPGIVLTEGVSAMGMNSETGFVQELVSKTPLGRPGTPEDIADVVTFLASEDARWVTGQIIQASGGLR